VEVLIIRLLKEWYLMAAVARIPRRRGGVCGVLLILLGAWGGLAPFVGPYFHFAYSPDKAWAYTTGRLYLSVIPGGVALLAGLVVLLTRLRGVGVIAGVLGVLAGAWFVVGAGFVTTVLNRPSITPGVPVPHSGYGIASSQWSYLETIGFFTGVGVLIVGVSAIVMGRFSMLSASDAVDAQDVDFDQYPSVTPADATLAEPVSQTFTPSPRPFPGEETTQTQDAVPPFGTGQFPATSASPFPPAEPPGTFPRSSPTR
jgi:hypothetical protein